MAGFEPARLSARDFKSPVSAVPPHQLKFIIALYSIHCQESVKSPKSILNKKTALKTEVLKMLNNAWLKNTAKKEDVELFSDKYRAFLDNSKTERECVQNSISLAKQKGFVSFEEAIQKKGLCAGNKIYFNWMNKALILFIIGKEPIEKGLNILGAHIDSPRIDVKQNPFYEEKGLAYLDTHYYGGIKKYQWVTMPLSIHGIVVKKDGISVPVVIGEDEADPVFCITDLLPHLAQDQMSKPANKFIEGESLNLLIGNQPVEGQENDAVKTCVLSIIKEKYIIEEEDFLSAELEIVPAGKTRELGFDRSMILGYGHDDRSCAFASLAALLNFDEVPQYTLCCVLADKEEIGSVGATGMASHFFENTLADLLDAKENYSELTLRRALKNSRMLSSDVSAAYDPLYASAFEANNSAYLAHGISFNKYTGSRGKSGSNDANAEYVAEIRRIMDEASVTFQMTELGRVDQGGGGTIAYLCSKYGMNVIDCGIPVLSMHAPWEVISKIDLYEGYLCYCAFLKKAVPLNL